jgi:signal transduction histidine kinase
MTLPNNKNKQLGIVNMSQLLRAIPSLLLISWFVRFTYLYLTQGFEYLELNRTGSIIIIRYLMSFPAGLLSFVGLCLAGKKIKRIYGGKLHHWYYGLGGALLLYGIADGIFVRDMDFFPANLVNHQMFFQLTGVPIQVIKILLGILITYFVIQISMVFEREKKAIIDNIIERRAVEATKEKLNRDIHDRIIQKMYGASLKIEAYLGKGKEEYLQSAAFDLKDGIREARDIIGKTVLQNYHPSDIVTLIKDLINEKDEEAPFEIIFEDLTPGLSHVVISNEKANQIYYILQETLTNATKHSNAEKVCIRLKEEYDDLIIEIEDDGQGFVQNKGLNGKGLDEKSDIHDGKSMGMEIMRSRAAEIGGSITISSSPKGVRIKLRISMGGE